MSKLYIYEDGACRGDQFTNKNILNKADVISRIEEGLKLKKGTEEYDDYLEDNIYDHYEEYSVGVAIGAMINGSDCTSETRKDILKRFEDLKAGNGVVIELEESTIGIGPSKRKAREACASVMLEEW